MLAGGGRLAYAAAGSSGLMALADALEIPGTFGIARDRIEILLAEGAANLLDFPAGPEDDETQAARDVANAGIGKGDCLIALSASGTTPYAVCGTQGRRRPPAPRRSASPTMRARHCLALADIAILLPTPPEIIAGSTRMGAATAQKIALNMMSTLMAIHLGHVHDGHMVNLHAGNKKLKARAARIVAAISGRSDDEAARYLEAGGGSVKAAVLLAAGAADHRHAAKRLLEGANQNLRKALAKLDGNVHARRLGT